MSASFLCRGFLVVVGVGFAGAWIGVDGNGWGGTDGCEGLAEVGSPGGVVIFFSGVLRCYKTSVSSAVLSRPKCDQNLLS